MALYSIAEQKTLKWEGGYCNVSGDAGGETIFGMARNMHPNLELWKHLDHFKSTLEPFGKNKYKELEKLCKNHIAFSNEMQNFYDREFWSKIRGVDIKDQDLANALYDFAVNSGVSRAVKTLQKVLDVKQDGVIGENTLLAIENYKGNLCNDLCSAREEFFKEIAKKGQNAKFLNGWLNRVKDFYVKES